MIEHREDPWSDTLWRRLEALGPAAVEERTGARRQAGGGYVLAFLGRDYGVDPRGRRIAEPGGPAEAPDPDLRLVLLHYLCRGQRIPPSGRRISERELPSGATFFRGPHALPAADLARRFGRDAAGFLRAGRALGGRPPGPGAARADAALELVTLPDLPVTCLLWLEDDEFPARAAFLFDAVIEYQLPLDVILALVQTLVRMWLQPPPPRAGGEEIAPGGER